MLPHLYACTRHLLIHNAQENTLYMCMLHTLSSALVRSGFGCSGPAGGSVYGITNWSENSQYMLTFRRVGYADAGSRLTKDNILGMYVEDSLHVFPTLCWHNNCAYGRTCT